MEILLALFALGLVFVSPVLAVAALVRVARLQSRVRELESELDSLDTRVEILGRRAAAERAPGPPAETAATAAAAPAIPAERPTAPPFRPPVPTPQPSPPVAERPAPLPPRPAPPSPPRPSRFVTPQRPPPDFATNLGPKLLVGVGALAVVMSLGFFVKYAWENDWVGPAGRVMSGAVVSLGLVALGVRIMGGEYRPLGQGLAGTGLAGLYVSAFAAHGFYDLIPREMAGVFMAAITVNAILLSLRLDARLLATLAWVGGYMTPVLLSTGEDKALALYVYLALLDAGALVLDHRRPWPETVPLAFLGTLLLYGGWYAQFFRPERFEVAAFGIVLFTALFALGMARKERGSGLAFMLSAGALGISVLAAGADRPGALLVLSLALAGAALRASIRFGGALAAVAALAAGLPFVVWSASHFRAEAFGIAAAWVLAAMLLVALPEISVGARTEVPLEILALLAGGVAAIAMASWTNRPAALLAFLLAQGGLAILVRRRWAWAEVAGNLAGALAVLSWYDSFYNLGNQAHAGEAYLLTFPLAGLYLLVAVIRGLVLRDDLGTAGLAGHLANATFVWTILYRVLYDTSPGTLGAVSVALATLYLSLGLAAARERREDALQMRVLLGLAAAFLTLAIPVQLGLHGITLAWALEGLLLLALGLRFGSGLTRAGGYAVLDLAALRLLVRHLPLHAGDFRPVLNPAFGTWLAVIVALGGAVLLLRRRWEHTLEADRVLAGVLSTAALLLFFSLLTGETRSAFALEARAALAAGDAEAARSAGLLGGLALSVLWTLFATGLLASGLGLRNRPLFYSAYGLFAITAAKVVLWDLATLHTIYRILSFLALGVLLMAGAYLNLRFRGRLLPTEASE